MSVRRLAVLLAAAALAASLSACISVLPKSKPDQLYTFGHAPTPAPEPRSDGGVAAAGVLLAAIDFPRAALGDGILTMTGTQTAYIAQSRWAGPASILFREALQRAFDAQAHRTRLISRGETGRTVLILRVDVRDFEALYQGAPGAAPAVVVALRGRLTRPDGRIVDERDFAARIPAADNRVGPIVDAFDRGTAQALGALVAWTDQTAAALPPEPPAQAVTATTQSTTTTTITTPPASPPPAPGPTR